MTIYMGQWFYVTFLFGDVKLTKDVDSVKYKYSG